MYTKEGNFMSLTTVLDNKEIRTKFKQKFKKPRLEYSKNILIESKTKNYGLIGIAFDYLARFYIEKINVNTC